MLTQRLVSLADVPFAPRRLPFFYGWLLLGVATLGILASIPGQTMGISVFTDPLLEATGLSRLSVSQAYLAGTVLSGLTLPWAGGRVDRLGARPAGAFAAVGLGATLVFLAHLDRIAAALGGGVATALLLVLGFYAVRFTGQGLLTMVSRALIGRWFERRRGLAAGLSGVFVGFGFGAAPQLLDLWIRAAGWRGAWMQIAAVVAIGMGALVLVFYRDDPESCGLTPDGRPAPAATGETEVHEEVSFTRGEAVRTSAFWAVTASLACHSLVVTGVTFHIVDLGADAGLARAEAVQVFLPMAVVSTVTGLVGGWLADRVSVRSLLFALLFFESLGIVACADFGARFWLVVVGFGVGGGLFNPVGTVAYPRLFGRKHLGAILGVEMMSLVVGSAIGPVFLATAKDLTGGYAAGLYAALGFPLVAAGLAATFRIKRPGATAPS